MTNDSLDIFGVTEKRGVPVVSSRKVAEVFGRRHDNIMLTIKNAIDDTDFAPDFSGANFIESTFKDRGKKYPEYLLTRDGFSFIVMGFTGKKAAKFKIAYIQQFNEMETFIKTLVAAKLEFPEFTNAILSAHEEPKHYHFTNEINMINKIVLGMSTKEFKEVNALGDVSSIRPYLSIQQIGAIEKLQKFDTGLILTEDDFHKRKDILTSYYHRITSIKMLKVV